MTYGKDIRRKSAISGDNRRYPGFSLTENNLTQIGVLGTLTGEWLALTNNEC